MKVAVLIKKPVFLNLLAKKKLTAVAGCELYPRPKKKSNKESDL
jgi:hypothetical protein